MILICQGTFVKSWLHYTPITNYYLRPPLATPPPFSFRTLSKYDLRSASNPSFLRARSITSSAEICVRFACLAKDSRSLDAVSRAGI